MSLLPVGFGGENGLANLHLRARFIGRKTTNRVKIDIEDLIVRKNYKTVLHNYGSVYEAQSSDETL